MPDRFAIYQHQPWLYDELIAREDYEGNILKTLRRIHPFSKSDAVADIGAGTGRLSMLLSPFVGSLLLTDAAAPMLHVAKEKLTKSGFMNVRTVVADLSHIPTDDHALDAVVEGWAVCSAALRSSSWEQTIHNIVKEAERVVKPGGSIIFLETLGTGQEHPTPPNETFAALYRALEEQHGFIHESIRTDYKFHSLEEKQKLLTFFFDQEMLDAGVQSDSLIYPECTGVWWKKI